MAWSEAEKQHLREQMEQREAKVAAQLDGHYCFDWDELAVSAWTFEYDCCSCYPKSRLGRIVNWFVMLRFYFDWWWKIGRHGEKP